MSFSAIELLPLLSGAMIVSTKSVLCKKTHRQLNNSIGLCKIGHLMNANDEPAVTLKVLPFLLAGTMRSNSAIGAQESQEEGRMS